MENLFIEYDEEAKYLAEHVQCSFEDAQKYVDAEYECCKHDCVYNSKGL